MEDSNKDLLDSFTKSLYCPSCSINKKNKLQEIFVFKPPSRHYICFLCKTIWWYPEMDDEPSEPYLLKDRWLL